MSLGDLRIAEYPEDTDHHISVVFMIKKKKKRVTLIKIHVYFSDLMSNSLGGGHLSLSEEQVLAELHESNN